MAELTLKDESVIEIGQSVTKGFNDLVNSGKSVLINPAGQPLTSSAEDVSAEDNFIGPSMPETDQSGVIGVLVSIRDGIASLVESFADSLSFQKQEEKEAERADRVSSDDIAPSSDDGESGGIFSGAIEKFKNVKQGAQDLLSKDGLFGLLIKGGLIAGLLYLATMLKKYGKQIAKFVAPIVDGIKRFAERLSEDFGPLLKDAFSIISDAFSGIFDLIKGIFTLDGDLIKEGIDSLKTIPLRVATFLLDAAASLINSIGAAFGVEGDVITNILNFFTDIKNKIVESFNNALAFFTETIPAKVTEIKDSITSFFTDAFDNIKNGIKDAISSVGDFFSGIGDSIKTIINSAIQALPLPDFIKKKLKFETKASKAAGNEITETGIKAKYVDNDIEGMQREKMSGGTGALMDEGFAEATGEKYGEAKITKSGTDGYDFASGIMTPEQFKEFNKLDTDGQLEYLKNLDEEEQKRRDIIMKLKQDKIDHDKKLAKLIEEGKALQPEFGGEITSPDDQLLKDDMAYSQRTKQMKEDSAAIANKDAGKMNVINNSGGATSTNVANNTITNMAENTNTSDGNLRDALSA